MSFLSLQEMALPRGLATSVWTALSDTPGLSVLLCPLPGPQGREGMG